MSEREAQVHYAQVSVRNNRPRRGEVYRHYKGGLYVVLGQSVRESDLTICVHYKSLENGNEWNRPRGEWSEFVGDAGHVNRFTWTGVKLDL